uniref:F-box domain-containing protein n=1 Tax=Hordeum vulgare subsp. vulgare TaxID=112509 RepID=A0A8I6YJE4_HORVV
MRQEESGAELDDLPDEILVGKILMLLPPKDVGRCRAVCSSWRSATSTPEFMLDHHRRQPLLPIVDIYGGRPGVLRGPVDSVACQRLWPGLLPPWHRIHAAGHGFLVVSHNQLGSGYHICNPAIHQIALLPQPEFRPKNAILGLYRHDATGEYRMLWSSGHAWDETTLYVLTVGDNESRNIGLSSVSPPSLKHAVLDALPRGRYTAYNPPVHHRGNLHWMPTCHAEIVVFDTDTESFRLMRSATNSHCLEKLFDLEGKLAFSSHDSRSTYMDVWLMEDYAAEIWDLKYRIDLSSIQASPRPRSSASLKRIYKSRKMMATDVAPTTRFLSELVMVNERELLAGFSDKHVLRCNIDGKLSGMANIKGQCCYMEISPYRFKQSILPIPLI